MNDSKKTVNNCGAPMLYKAFAILEAIAADQQKLGSGDLAHKLNMSKVSAELSGFR